MSRERNEDRTPDDVLTESTSLYRHYNVEETQFALAEEGFNLTVEETIELMQARRDEAGMGPIDEWNLPGYEEEEVEEREQHGLLSWLFGR